MSPGKNIKSDPRADSSSYLNLVQSSLSNQNQFNWVEKCYVTHLGRPRESIFLICMTACASEERFSGGDVHSQAFSFMSMPWRVIFSSFCYISESLLAAEDTDVPAESLLPGSPCLFLQQPTGRWF